MKVLCSIVGSIALVLGALGLFLPLLPTTPLWLLAAYCFLRGNHRLYNWAMSIPVFNKVVVTFSSVSCHTVACENYSYLYIMDYVIAFGLFCG